MYKRRKLLIGFVLLNYFLVLYSETKENDLDQLLIQSPHVIKFTRSWDEIKILIGQSFLSKEKLRIRECSISDYSDIKVFRGISMRVFRSYLAWNEYKWGDGSICVEMKYPRLGFLKNEDIQLLLTISNSENYMKTGWISGLKLYFYKLEDFICSSSFTAVRNQDTNDVIGYVDACGYSTS